MSNSKKLIRVRDVMKPNYDMIDGKLTVEDALRAMRHVETKTLIVEKRDEDDEYGGVLISDIAKQVLAKDRSPKRVNIYEIMSKPVLGVDPDMDVRYCTKLFDRFCLSRSPVIEDGKIIGLVSYTDIVLKGVMLQD